MVSQNEQNSIKWMGVECLAYIFKKRNGLLKNPSEQQLLAGMQRMPTSSTLPVIILNC